MSGEAENTIFGHFLPIWSMLLFGDPVQCSPVRELGAKKQHKMFWYKVFREPFGSWTSAPRIVDVRTKKCVFCSPGDGEKLFDPGASGRKGEEYPREIRTEKFMFILFVLPSQMLVTTCWTWWWNCTMSRSLCWLSSSCNPRLCCDELRPSEPKGKLLSLLSGWQSIQQTAQTRFWQPPWKWY